MSAQEPRARPRTAEPPERGRSRIVRGRGAGTPMRVLAIERGGTRARCAGFDGVPATVETALVGPLEAGAVVLVHAGVALAQLDAEWVP